uniref:Uncharacterized protein n=1 Tax=Arthroderma otae (strain ATCC MYA-4605 / CBS 113480) TaxID=554155 RepID=C5FLL1_ARTOC|nr:uncharacterized protein MCYG_03402 [Microsporum canis CBS 113480]EEQ30583.1 predicted protein [Microsporum canis CBS 113480]
MGLCTILTIPIQASAPKAEDRGLAVGILVSFRLFGALIGLAIGATTFSSVFANSIASISKLEGLPGFLFHCMGIHRGAAKKIFKHKYNASYIKRENKKVGWLGTKTCISTYGVSCVIGIMVIAREQPLL